ncbi:MAG: dioxygenase [Alphaproteobacteria bacterium]|nr:dioxygenase [Alphaproteobacteria bacterium]
MATYFIGHGAPTLPLQDIPARHFLAGLGRTIEARQGRPRAILCVSAHWETDVPAVSLCPHPETIHDFYGFPEELYRLRYDAPGAPAVAEQAAALIERAGMTCRRDAGRGLDHGTWIPLMLLWPDADIPVAQIAIQPHLGPAHHLALGRALAELTAKDVLLLASGGAVHNLQHIFREGGMREPAPPDWAMGFDRWLADALHAGDEARLLDYRRASPDAVKAHPRDEHLIPLFVALGAAGPDARVERLHASFDFGSLSLAAYAFEPAAAQAA